MKSYRNVRSRRDKYILVLFTVVFAAAGAMLFWKCRFGFPYEESFYTYTAYRFVNGDLPILHEWHMSQMSHFFLEIPVAVYLYLTSGTEGIILFIRYVFTSIWIITAIFLYYRTRKLSRIGAMITSLVFLIFVPCGQMTIFYYSMGILTLAVSAVLIITSERLRKLQIVISGVFFSLAVIFCPYLALMAILIPVSFVVGRIRKDESLIEVVWCIPGIILSAVVFCICVMRHEHLGDYLNVLPNILKDSEHSMGFLSKTVGYFTDYFSASAVSIFTFVIAAGVIVFVMRSGTERMVRTGFIIECTLSVIQIVVFFVQDSLVNYYMMALWNIGLYIRFFDKDKTNRMIFNFMWIPGILYSFFIHLSSNMGAVVISSAMTVSVLAGILMSARFVSAINDKKVSISFVTAASVLLTVLLVSRFFYVCFEKSIFDQTNKVDQGICKGLYISDEPYYKYVGMHDSIEAIRNNDAKRVIILSSEWWMYLASEKMIGAYTAWTPVLSPNMLDEYYRLYPDMRPDLVFLDSDYSSLIPQFELQGYKDCRKMRNGYILLPLR